MDHSEPGVVLVVTDLAAVSDEAIRQGAAIALGTDRTLVVWCRPPAGSALERVFHSRHAGHVRDQDAGTQIDRALGPGPRGVDVQIIDDTRGADLCAIVDRTDASLIVTGPGAATGHAVDLAPVPVLTARASPRGAVVVATDFLSSPDASLRSAAREACRRGAPLHLLHVLDSSINLLGDTSEAIAAATGLAAAHLGSDTRRVATEHTLQARLRGLDTPGRIVVVDGRADAAIVGYAESIAAGLVVVGRHGGSPMMRRLLGSTATSVAESAPCSVLIVPSVMATQVASLAAVARPAQGMSAARQY